VIVHACDQRSDAWHALRLGKLTGTGAADMLCTIKKGEAAARRDLRLRLVCERLTGQSAESDFVSKEMQRGIDLEGAARAAYEAATGHLVRPVGFVAHDDLLAGCSPDGEVKGFTGIVEIKCPKPATHLGYVRARQVPGDYRAQITHNLWVTGAQWCDFVSYDDRFPEALRLFIIRVPRSEVEAVAYEVMVRSFLAEVERELADVQGLLVAA
jgi:predicted phage-related endonuclease